MASDLVRIALHVQPNAGRNRVVGFRDNVLYLKIAAPAVDGKANHETIKYLSGVAGVPRTNVRIERGASGRNKMVAITGIDRDRLLLLLGETAGGPD